jgi:biopolymer transport protein ExbD
MKRQRRRPSLLPRPDFTPFVAVGFILITFFVWLKQLQRDTYTTLNAPGGRCWKVDAVPIKLQLFLFLLADYRLGVLTCQPNTDVAQYYETPYSPTTIRRLLHVAEADKTQMPVVIIKPTAQTTFKNLVDVLDDFHQNRRVRYLLIDQFIPEEQQLIRQYTRYRLSHPDQPRRVRLRLYHPWRFVG